MATVIETDAGDSTTTYGKAKRISSAVVQTVTTIMLLCAKQAITASKKLKNNTKISQGSPKKLISSIGNKATKLRHRMRKTGDGGSEYGGDGVWRREILMGDKCQPLDFSGVIYYDKDGNLLDEVPMRTPRASPFNGYACTPAKSGRTAPAPARRESPFFSVSSVM